MQANVASLDIDETENRHALNNPNMRPGDRNDFEIAIICALPHEADAVEALFDETFDKLGQIYGKQKGDVNVYSNGRLGQHHVVLCYLPEMGKRSAASAASSLMLSYPKVQLALVVGICGAVPFPASSKTEIILGDVIISDSVVECDFGRQFPDKFRRKRDVTETLGRPNREIRTLLASMKTCSARAEFQNRISHHLRAIQEQLGDECKYPGAAHDILFEASYRHRHYQSYPGERCICFDSKSSNDPVCEEALKGDCDSIKCTGKPVYRRRHGVQEGVPHVHIGSIASADTVMKSGEHRDEVARNEGIIGFEMEGAGVWDNFPCVIIKGVCDYADSHKNKIWQTYAAAIGASGAKAFLEYWRPSEDSESVADADKRCLSDLLLTDPRDDKLRIEGTKGGLLRESFCWILEHPIFQQWRFEKQRQLLWVRGDAGKGKTMLMIGVIDELKKQGAVSSPSEDSPILSYFLCQGTDSRLNNVVSVLRGLIYLLAIQRPMLLRYLRLKYDHAGRRLFEDPNTFYGLLGIFLDMVQDPRLPEVYFVVDAVDECEADLPQLLGLITQTMTMQSRIKWILSSRNRDDIEQLLGSCDFHKCLRLELNPNYTVKAINSFIDTRVSQLVSLQHDSEIRDKVKDKLQQKSDGTFLWAALVIEELRKVVLAADALEVIEETPQGLIPLFEQMMQRIQTLHPRSLQRCLRVLSAAALAYRPLHLLEMRVTAGLPMEISYLPELDRIVSMCGSFLTVREHHVYFIHQSAKDYLTTYQSAIIFDTGQEKVHFDIYSRSISAMSSTLRQNICDLKHPGPLEKLIACENTALIPIRYACVHWFEHLCQAVVNQSLEKSKKLCDDDLLEFFDQHLLHWLESLGLLREISVGILIFKKIFQTARSGASPRLATLMQDALRLTLTYGPTVERAPLQIYGAAICFCPQNSEIKKRFWDSRLPFVKEVTGIRKNWDGCLQRLEGHRDSVNDVSFSPDGQTLATASSDYTVKLWDTTSGFETKTLEGHKEAVNSICFLHDRYTLASGSDDGKIFIWNTITGAYETILESNEGMVSAICFSYTSQTLAAGLSSGTVLLWNYASKTWKQIFQGRRNLAEANRVSSEVRMSLEQARNQVFATNEAANKFIERKISLEEFRSIKDAEHNDARDVCREHLHSISSMQSNRITNIRYSSDGKVMAVASKNGTVRLWYERSDVWETILHYEHDVYGLAFSPDGQTLAVALHHGKVQLWDRKYCAWKPITIDDPPVGLPAIPIKTVFFSPDGQMLYSALGSSVYRWNLENQDLREVISVSDFGVSLISAEFSPDGQVLALTGDKGKSFIWDHAIGDPSPSNTGAESASRANSSTAQKINASTSRSCKTALKYVCAVAYVAGAYTLWLACVLEVLRSDARLTALILLYAFVSFLCMNSACPLFTLEMSVKYLPVRATSAKECIYILWVSGMAEGLDFLLSSESMKPMPKDCEFPLEWDTSSQSWVLKGHLMSVDTLALSPSGRILATGGHDRTVHLWDTAAKTWERKLEGHKHAIWRIKFSPTGDSLITISHYCETKLWDTASGVCRKTFPGKTSNVVFSPDNQNMISILDNYTANIHGMELWDATSLRRRRVLRGHKAEIYQIAFTSNNQTFASISSDDTVRIWDLRTGASKYVLKVSNVGEVAFAPDNRILALALGNGSVRLWDTVTKAWKLTLSHNEEENKEESKDYAKISFSPDGQMIAVSSRKNHTIAVWDVYSGDCKQTFNVDFQHVSFSKDGQFLVTEKNILPIFGTPSPRIEFRESTHRAIGYDGEWLTLDEQKILWFPLEYRSRVYKSHESTFIFGDSAGRVVFIEIDV